MRPARYPAASRIFGVARSALTRISYTAQAEAACREFLGKEFDAKQWLGFSRLLDYIKIDGGAEADFAALPAIFKDRDAVVRVFFFSTASNLFSAICQNLAKAKVVTPLSRVVLEKPLGHDTASANLINEQVGAVFAEKQIYRIDHYLGKEAVQNLMALRFGNLLFEPLWRRGYIKHVQITVAEELGVERRGNFYDKTGAMRDMMQNHLLQLLCIMAMEPPASSDPDAVRDEKLKVLKALRPLRERDVLTEIGARPVQGRRGSRRAGAGIPAGGRHRAGQQHRNLRGAESRHRYLALGGRAVLSAHGKAAAGQAHGARRHLRGGSSSRFSRYRAPIRPMSWSFVCSRMNASP